MIYVAITALVISALSLFLAFISFRRSRVFQDLEYATRLQMLDEVLKYAHETFTQLPALSYHAQIENRGLKPVRLDSVTLDYGHRTNREQRVRHEILGETYLLPGKTQSLAQEITQRDVRAMKERY